MGAPRQVPTNDRVARRFERMPHHGESVFQSRRGGRYTEFKKGFKAAVEVAEITGSHLPRLKASLC